MINFCKEKRVSISLFVINNKKYTKNVRFCLFLLNVKTYCIKTNKNCKFAKREWSSVKEELG